MPPAPYPTMRSVFLGEGLRDQRPILGSCCRGTGCATRCLRTLRDKWLDLPSSHHLIKRGHLVLAVVSLTFEGSAIKQPCHPKLTAPLQEARFSSARRSNGQRCYCHRAIYEQAKRCIMSMIKLMCCAVSFVMALSTADAAENVRPLPKLNIDGTRIGVTGISAGAFMAIQMQMTHPELFKRAGIVAGGPYACAEDLNVTNNTKQMFRCMDDKIPGYEATSYMTDANIAEWARRASSRAAGVRQPSRFAALNGGVVYFLHGTEDTTVLPIVAEAAVKQYAKLWAITYTDLAHVRTEPVNIEKIDDGSRLFGHTFPTRLPRRPAAQDDCDNSVYPYIGHCGIDGAELIFTNLFGSPTQPVAEQSTGQLVTFDQTAIGPPDAQMADTGYAYIPRACADGEACGVLVALHGCNQAAESMNTTPNSQDPGPIGDRFATQTGFNRWADAYRVMMLYPQVRPTPMSDTSPQANYNGCYDWWGYTGQDYDLRTGKQIKFIASLLSSVGYSADNSSAPPGMRQ